MAKEKFLIVAIREMDDCFSRFSESANRAALDAGTADPDDPYSWIEATYSIQLRRWREATHICSITPSAYYVNLQNVFVGIPNEAWDKDAAGVSRGPDPDGLEYQFGGEMDGYGTYRDEYPAEFVCETFTLDTIKVLGLRKPSVRNSLSRRTDAELECLDAYHTAIWQAADESASEIGANGGFWADGLDVYKFRQRERLKRAATHAGSLPLFSGYAT